MGGMREGGGEGGGREGLGGGEAGLIGEGFAEGGIGYGGIGRAERKTCFGMGSLLDEYSMAWKAGRFQLKKWSSSRRDALGTTPIVGPGDEAALEEDLTTRGRRPAEDAPNSKPGSLKVNKSDYDNNLI